MNLFSAPFITCEQYRYRTRLRTDFDSLLANGIIRSVVGYPNGGSGVGVALSSIQSNVRSSFAIWWWTFAESALGSQPFIVRHMSVKERLVMAASVVVGSTEIAWLLRVDVSLLSTRDLVVSCGMYFLASEEKVEMWGAHSSDAVLMPHLCGI